MSRLLLLLAFPLALAACSATAPISNAPLDVATSIIPKQATDTVQTGLVNASWNLHQAQAIGVLKPNDAAQVCVDGTLTDLGIDPTTGNSVKTGGSAETSFTPKVSDLISLGSVIYIRAEQLQTAKQSIALISTNCDAIVGKFVRLAARSGLQLGAQAARIGRALAGAP